MKQSMVIVFLLLGISGCTKELKVDFGEPAKKIVLYPVLTNNKKIVINMTGPTSILSNRFPILNNPSVLITDNNVTVDTVTINAKGKGYSKIIPVPGHEYGFRATATGYPEAYCEAQLPKQVEAWSVDTAYLTWYSYEYMRARLRIRDDPNTINYYKATIDEKKFLTIRIVRGKYPNILDYDSSFISIHKPQLYANIPDIGFFYNVWLRNFFMAEDKIAFGDGADFRRELGSEIFFEGSEFYFPDDLFNGKEMILDIIVGGPNSSSDSAKYMIELTSISEDYYKGVKSYARYGTKEAANLPMAEEVSIYSAVKGGYGFPVASTTVIDSTYWIKQ